MASRPIVSSILKLFVVAVFYQSIKEATTSPPPHDGRKLLVIMIDGFRWDYFKQFGTNNLSGFNRLRSAGVSAGELLPQFPSLSFVNYYSLMTGMTGFTECTL